MHPREVRVGALGLVSRLSWTLDHRSSPWFWQETGLKTSIYLRVHKDGAKEGLQSFLCMINRVQWASEEKSTVIIAFVECQIAVVGGLLSSRVIETSFSSSFVAITVAWSLFVLQWELEIEWNVCTERWPKGDPGETNSLVAEAYISC